MAIVDCKERTDGIPPITEFIDNVILPFNMFFLKNSKTLHCKSKIN